MKFLWKTKARFELGWSKYVEKQSSRISPTPFWGGQIFGPKEQHSCTIEDSVN